GCSPIFLASWPQFHGVVVRSLWHRGANLWSHSVGLMAPQCYHLASQRHLPT
ncbi:hypothetical protein PanWU01x14_019720, partial [Parasponia andersonii]